MRPWTIAVVDDSPVVRAVLRRIIKDDPSLLLVAEGATGEEALRIAVEHRPDLMTLDLQMPGDGGLAAIEAIMAKAPTRLLVVTGVPRYLGLDANFQALARGALDLIAKNELLAEGDAEAGVALRARLRSLLDARPEAALFRSTLSTTATEAPRVIVVGASTGGPRAAATLLGSLPQEFSIPIVLVQHMTAAFSEGFIAWLARQTVLRVEEATVGARPRPGHVYVVTRGTDLGFGPDGSLRPVTGYEGIYSPSVDAMFSSTAEVFGARGFGVLLTGMGKDGAHGLKKMRERGATTIAESEESAVVFGMPRAAIEIDAASRVLSLSEIMRTIAALASDSRGGAT